MKIDAKMLRRMVKEELSREVESQMNETGGYGSARGRAESDENFDAAVQTLIDLMGVTRDRAITAVQSLRGGGDAGDHWTAGLNQDSPDARMRAETDEAEDGEALDEIDTEVDPDGTGVFGRMMNFEADEMEDGEEMSEIDEEEVDETDEMEEGFSGGPDPRNALSIGAIMFLKGALGDATWREVGGTMDGSDDPERGYAAVLTSLGKEDLIDATRRHNESVETRSLVGEMEGHIENVMKEALDRTPVRPDFNSNRLAHLAGIMEE
jgi:hypothetical protein